MEERLADAMLNSLPGGDVCGRVNAISDMAADKAAAACGSIGSSSELLRAALLAARAAQAEQAERDGEYGEVEGDFLGSLFSSFTEEELASLEQQERILRADSARRKPLSFHDLSAMLPDLSLDDFESDYESDARRALEEHDRRIGTGVLAAIILVILLVVREGTMGCGF